MLSGHNIKISADSSNAVRAIEAVNRSWTEMRSKIELVGMGVGAIKTIGESLAKVGGRIDQINQSAASLSRYGLGKGMLAGLAQETGDVVDRLTLATEAAQVMKSGIVQSMDDISAAYRWAIVRGRDVGMSAEDAIKKITDALTKGTTKPLAEFGEVIEIQGDKIEKSKEMLARIKKEVSLFADEYRVSMDSVEERTQAFRNALLGTIESFSAFGQGFNLIKDSLEFAAKKLGKSVEQIWAQIEEAGQAGYKRLVADVDTAARILVQARAAGDTAAIAAAEERLKRLQKDAKMFQVQFNDLYEKFGKPTGAAVPGVFSDIPDVVQLTAELAANIETTDQELESLLRTAGTTSAQQMALLKKQTEDYARGIIELQGELAEARARMQSELQKGDAGEKKFRFWSATALQLEDWLKGYYKSGAEASKKYLELSKGQGRLAAELNARLFDRSKELYKQIDAVRREKDERAKMGALVNQTLGDETKLADMKRQAKEILEQQLTVAKAIGDEQKIIAIEAEKESLEKISTLEAFLSFMDKAAKKEEKKPSGEDADRKRLELLRVREQVFRSLGAEIEESDKQEIERLEKIIRFYGRAREIESARIEATIAATERLKQLEEERLSAIVAEGEEDERIKKAANEQWQKILADRRKELRLFGQESREEVKALLEIYEQNKEKGAEGFAPAIEALQKLADMEDRLQAIYEKKIKVEKILGSTDEARKNAIFSQYAGQERLNQLQEKELELKKALRDSDLQRADALRAEIEQLYRSADAAGESARKMDALKKEYSQVISIGTGVAQTLAQVAWADKQALESYGGSRKKMFLATFKEQMQKIAIEEAVKAQTTAAEAMAASVLAPAASGALWTASAMHLAASLAAGAAAAGAAAAGGNRSKSAFGGSGSSASKSDLTRPVSQPAEKEQSIEITVTLQGKSGWESELVEAIYTAQKRGRARRFGV